MQLTRHAARRMQQRGIPPMVLEWVVDFGVAHEQAGATLYALDRRSRRKLATHTGGISQRSGHWLDLCVVVGRNGQVITTYFRDARIRNH